MHNETVNELNEAWISLSKAISADVKNGCADAKLEGLVLVLYPFSHGTAGDDALRKFRPMLEIKRRLRHRSDGSMARYEKAARAQAEAQKQPRGSRAFGQAVEAQLAEMMPGQARPPPLP